MGKISKKNNGDPSKEVQWTSVMNSALVDTFLHQVNTVGRVNGTFTFKAYDDIVKKLVDKFHLEINNDNVKNLQKTLGKKKIHEFHDIFKDELSVFGWNDSLHIWIATKSLGATYSSKLPFFVTLILYYVIMYLLYYHISWFVII